MTQDTHRPKRRIAFGIIAIILGIISLAGLSSTGYYLGLGAFSGAYGAVLIALGIALVMKKEHGNV